jgi:hypothetical protein
MIALITGLIPLINFIINKCSRSEAIALETKRNFIKAVIEGLSQGAKSVALKDSWDAQKASLDKELAELKNPTPEVPMPGPDTKKT